MLAKYKFQNTALLMSQIILVNFERLRYTSCNIVNVDHNKNKKRKHCPRMRKRDCNPPLSFRTFFKDGGGGQTRFRIVYAWFFSRFLPVLNTDADDRQCLE